MQAMGTKAEGFTLVEFLVAMGLFALFTTLLCMQFSTHMRSFVREKSRIDTQQRMRSVLNWLEEDIRLAGFDPLALPASSVGIEIAEASHFAFSYRVDQDGDDAWSAEDWKRIDYYTENDGGLRRRERNTPTSPGSTSIILDKASIQFAYLDQNHEVLQGIQTSDLEKIRAVKVVLRASFQNSDSGQNIIAFATTVQCRNLGGKS